jgi:hypothetical protein
MQENNKQYAGRKYLCLARCSTTQQADTSIPDQLKLLRAFGDENGMQFVDSVVLDGVTGSVPGARSDIEQIVARKNAKNDFDVLLVQDMSRFTRSGSGHGAKLEYDLNAAGIDVLFVADHLPEGDHSGIIKTVGFYAAQQYAKSLSFAVARGSMSSLEQGRIAHCNRTPYGVDRLYVGLDGKPLHIIRNLADATQQKLHPETGVVLQTFEVGRESSRACHYRMQSNERIILIPGDPDRVDVVRHMFRRRLIDGWAGCRIATELNRMGLPSGAGNPWSIESVNMIVRNCVYTGIGIANRYSSAIYNQRSKNSPSPSTNDRKSLANRKRPARRVRPRADWMEIAHPMLDGYLGDLRDRAIAWQKKQLDKQDRGRIHTPASKDRHIDSSYFLKGILRSSDGYPLTGKTSSPQNRYYMISRGYTRPVADKTMRHLIPADKLEHAILAIVRDMLLAAPAMKDRLIEQIEAQRAKTNAETSDVPKLEAERAKLQSQIEFVIDSLGSIGQNAAKTKLQQLEAKLTTVIGQIDQANTITKSDLRSATTIADDMIAQLTTVAGTIQTMPLPILRPLLQSLIARLEVDMTTKAVKLDLAIPSWAPKTALCLEGRSVQRDAYQAQYEIPLESADCSYVRVGRTACFNCRRSPRAA